MFSGIQEEDAAGGVAGEEISQEDAWEVITSYFHEIGTIETQMITDREGNWQAIGFEVGSVGGTTPVRA